MLQTRLQVKLGQRQVLTPGLMQMVGVLALSNLELKDMINTELVENPVLEEIDLSAETLDERAGKEGDRERSAEQVAAEGERVQKDPFDEIDFDNYFKEYMDPGFRTPSTFEEYDKPSFEHFLSAPSTLSDHLLWQLGSMTLEPGLRVAAEIVIGNLDEDGLLTASDAELELLWVEEARGRGFTDLDGAAAFCERARAVVMRLDPLGVGARDLRECLLVQIEAERDAARQMRRHPPSPSLQAAMHELSGPTDTALTGTAVLAVDPAVVLASDLCAMQVRLWETAQAIVDHHLQLLQRKDLRELARLLKRPADEVNAAVEAIRRLDPRPGRRFNQSETRLIEPDLAFVRRGDEWVVVVNEDDLPSLRLNQGYRRMMTAKGAEREVKEYVKERYRSAIQLLRNIEQRKNTIVRTGEVIVRRQREFLDRGADHLKPMMIKEVAEEIGVHPSTVSRTVSNKYVLTPQGVYELRYFFSEGVGGPEGGDLPQPLLKKKVRRLIEEEDPRRPKTDEALAAELQAQGIQVTRRTVAKYREDMGIPSTHQRRQR